MCFLYVFLFFLFKQNLPACFFPASSQQMRMRRQSRPGRTVNATASKDRGMRRKSTVVLILSFEKRLITAGEPRTLWAGNLTCHAGGGKQKWNREFGRRVSVA